MHTGEEKGQTEPVVILRTDCFCEAGSCGSTLSGRVVWYDSVGIM